MTQPTETELVTADAVVEVLAVIHPAAALAVLDGATDAVPPERRDTLRGWCLLRVSQVEEAAACARRRLSAAPDDRDALLLWATTLDVSGQPRSARVVVHDLLRRFPHDHDALLLLAALEAQTQEWVDALNTADTAVQLFPYSDTARLQMARTLAAVGRRTEARQHYLTAMSLGSRGPAEVEYARVLLDDKEFAEATERLAGLWDANPHVDELRQMLLRAADGVRIESRALVSFAGALIGLGVWYALFGNGRSPAASALGLLLPLVCGAVPAILVTAHRRRRAFSRPTAQVVRRARRQAARRERRLSLRVGLWIVAAMILCLVLVAKLPTTSVTAQPLLVFAPPLAIVVMGLVIEDRRVSRRSSTSPSESAVDVSCQCDDVDVVGTEEALAYQEHLTSDKSWAPDVTQHRCPVTGRTWIAARTNDSAVLVAVTAPDTPVVSSDADAPGFYL